MVMNKIYFGDNLDIMRKYIKDESVDLIYLDPPFNSNRAYNIIYGKEEQFKVFDDTWTWTGDIPKTYDDIIHCGNDKIIDVIEAFHSMLGDNNMTAYLVMMTVRLIELHRVLKDTGSIYLHCDPTASHYLKIIMDNIFGIKNFRNEIVWCYSGGGVPKNAFARKHDVLLFYSKSNKNKFNCQYMPYSEASKKLVNSRGGTSIDGKKRNIKRGAHLVDWWSDMNALQTWSKERTGYPTQKPEKLLERIIKASSNSGDVVLDPFCGCATTMVVAEKLKRTWIGIDITYQSFRLLKERLRKNSVLPTDFIVEGEPTTMQQVDRLIEERGRFRFQDWITGKIGGIPNTKKTADKGEDGYYYWKDNKETKKAIISVKSGHVAPTDIRDLVGTIDKKADVGIFLTLKEPSTEMVKKAVTTGFIYDSFGQRYPKIQILTVEEILNGKKLDLPQ